MSVSAGEPVQTTEPPLPSLRSHILTKDRQLVPTTGDVWFVHTSPDGGDRLSFNWTAYRTAKDGCAVLDERSEHILRLYAAYKLATCKSSTLKNTCSAMLRLLRWYPQYAMRVGRDPATLTWRTIDGPLMEAMLVHGLSGSERGNDFSRLRDLYVWGAFGSQLPDFDPELAVALEAVRAPGNIKGAAVRGHDPEHGPLDADEQRLLIEAVQRAEGNARDRAVVMLYFELGLNTEAGARLRGDGLIQYTANIVGTDGFSRQETAYHLAVPRMKKRTELRETRNRPLSQDLGDLLMQLRPEQPEAPLLDWLHGPDSRSRIRGALQRWVKAANLISPRTGQLLRLSPRRLRYTLATQMAAEGASRHKIADVLDHTDLQNVEVYIEASSSMARQVATRLDQHLEAVVRRFQGKVVGRTGPASLPGVGGRVVPGSVLQLPMLPVDVGGIGVCGRNVQVDGVCRLAPPLSCYGCDKFAAFVDAPHAQVGDALERLIGSQMNDTADARIPLQLVDTVLAIRQCDAQCQAQRAETPPETPAVTTRPKARPAVDSR
jgi:integrase